MPQHEIERLLPRHFQILDLALAGNGPKEIAQALEMSPIGVGLIMKAPIFQAELARRRERLESKIDDQLSSIPSQAMELLRQNALAAAQVHVDCLNDVNPAIKQKSADAIMDRVFGKGEGSLSVKNAVIMLDPKALDLLRLAMEESNGQVLNLVEEKEVLQSA